MDEKQGKKNVDRHRGFVYNRSSREQSGQQVKDSEKIGIVVLADIKTVLDKIH